MLSANDAMNTWKEILATYNKTREVSPKETIRLVSERCRIADVAETLAIVAKIKKHDGRIYGKNREFVNAIQTDAKLSEWGGENPMIRCKLDDIHPSHINQLITEVRRLVTKQ